MGLMFFSACAALAVQFSYNYTVDGHYAHALLSWTLVALCIFVAVFIGIFINKSEQWDWGIKREFWKSRRRKEYKGRKTMSGQWET